VLVFAGIASLILGALYESGIFGATRCWGFSLGANPKHALLAPMLLRTRTAGMYLHFWGPDGPCLINFVGIILVFSFFQTMSFNAGTFYLALYYQVSLSRRLICLVMLKRHSVGARFKRVTCWNAIITLHVGVVPRLANWILHLRKDQGAYYHNSYRAWFDGYRIWCVVTR
jgi:hypothetical protein